MLSDYFARSDAKIETIKKNPKFSVYLQTQRVHHHESNTLRQSKSSHRGASRAYPLAKIDDISAQQVATIDDGESKENVTVDRLEMESFPRMNPPSGLAYRGPLNAF